MCAWVKPIPARAAKFNVGRVNILEILPLILKHTGILETCTIFKFCYIASEHACSAPLQTADEYIPVVIMIVVLFNCILFHLSLVLAESKMNSYLPARPITEHRTAIDAN